MKIRPVVVGAALVALALVGALCAPSLPPASAAPPAAGPAATTVKQQSDLPVAAHTWMFAEGTTLPAFWEYLVITNPDPTKGIVVTIDYQLEATPGSPLTPVTQDLTVPAASRATVPVYDAVGRDVNGVSARLTSADAFVAERPIYLVHDFDIGLIDGATDAVGVNAAATSWYFAEGSTLPGFQPYFAMQNLSGGPADVRITYYTNNPDSVVVRNVTIPDGARLTTDIANRSGSSLFPGALGPGYEGFGTAISSSRPIVVERPLYFDHDFPGAGSVDGASDQPGATTPSSTQQLFAEGSVLDDFAEFLTIFNPNSTPALLELSYSIEGGTGPILRSLAVPGLSRRTVQVFNAADPAGLGRAAAQALAPGSAGVSVAVASTNGVGFVAERPLYFDHDFGNGLIDGGHDVVGAARAAPSWVFAEGTLRPGFFEFATILNPNPLAARVRLDWFRDGGTPLLGFVSVPASSRTTVVVFDPRDPGGPGLASPVDVDLGFRATSIDAAGLPDDTRPIVVERPIYVNTPIADSPIPVNDGHDTLGFLLVPVPPLPPVANLSLLKTASEAPVVATQELTYTLAVTNNGPDPAKDVTVTDTLPPGTTLVRSDSRCSGSSIVACPLGDVTNGGHVEVILVVTVPRAAGTITNNAIVASATSDPDRSDNSASVATEVIANPIARADHYATEEDTLLTVTAPGVLVNDSDPNNVALTAELVTPTTHGSVALAGDGSFTYSPAPNFEGVDTFTYAADDGALTSTPGTVTLAVGSINDAPSFTSGPDQSVLEDAGAESVAWASNVSAGPPDESGQALTFHVTPANPGLFALSPAIAANGTLSYTPAPDANGSSVVSVSLQDDGGTANGGSDTSPTVTFTISVTPVNDAPSFDITASVSVPEDSGASLFPSFASSVSAGPADESSQQLTFTVSTDNPALFSVTPTLSPTGTLNFVSAPDAFGSAVLSATLQDSGGTANGGVDTSVVVTQTITVRPVNDAPLFLKGPDQNILEDAGAQSVVAWASAISAGPPNESGQGLTFTVTSTVSSLFSSGPAVSPDGTLSFTPALNQNGTATISVTLTDTGGTVDGGHDTSPTLTFTISVLAVNDAPSFTKGADQGVLEDAGPQSVAGWATSISPGPPDEAGQSVRFTLTNTNSSLFLVQPAVTAGGTLSYTPAGAANGSAVVSVILTDNGGTALGGHDASAPVTFTISVTAVNDAPSFTKGPDQSVLEDAVHQSVPGWASNILRGPPDEAGQSVDFVVTNTLPGLFLDPPGVAPDGALTYTLAADANGSATVWVHLHDNGGTANSGVDSSPLVTFTISVTPVNDAPSFTKGPNQSVLEDAVHQSVPGWATNILPGPPDEAGQSVDFVVTNTLPGLFLDPPGVAPDGTLTYTLAADANGSATVWVHLHDNGGTANSGVDSSPLVTFAISVTPVNDAPSFTKGPNQSVLEDSGPITATNWASSISAGPPDEAGQSVAFTLTPEAPSLFAVPPAVSSAGTLTFMPALNANGSTVVTATIRDSGGTANGGVDHSQPVTFTITITAVNDPPSFTPGPNQGILEDAGPQSLAWATGISPGPSDEAGQAVHFIVSNDNPGLFSVSPTISPTGTLTYTGAAEAVGAATVTVTLQDNGGTANGGVDTSPPVTFTISVTTVNDAPSFTPGPNQSILEDAGGQTVPAWATNISTGPADEAGQLVDFRVSSNNPSLFVTTPTITADGTLTYTTAPDANGGATLTVALHDNGGTANGGVDTSPAVTFTISVTAVNDVPTFAIGPDQEITEDAPPITVTAWATNILAGPPDEAGQTLTFTVTNDNPDLFSVSPTISPDGSLTYGPAPNANGLANVSVTLSDNGGTANGGVDTGPVEQFLITVPDVNDAPSFTGGPDQVSLEDAGPATVPNWATDISTGPPDEAGQLVGFLVDDDNPSLFVTTPTIDEAGTLTYTAAPDANGTATVTVAVQDSGGTLRGGIDTSPSVTFTIAVVAVNDAPTFDLPAPPDQAVLNNAGPQTVPAFATNISPGPPDEAGQSVSFELTPDIPSLFLAGPAINPLTGDLTYTPNPSGNATATVTVTLSDDGGTANGGLDLSAPQTFLISITPPEMTPVASGGSASTFEDTPVDITLTATDANSDPLSFSIASPPAAGVLGSIGTPACAGVTCTASVTYTPNANVNGLDSFVFRVDDGRGGQATATITVTVTPVNDAPTFTRGPNETVLEDSGLTTFTGWATNITPGPANESGQQVTFTITSNQPGLFQVLTMSITGDLKVQPAPNANGTATITVTLHDNGGTANGGSDATALTATVVVTPVNDVPSFTKGPDVSSLEDAGTQTFGGWATAISAGPPDEAGQTVSFSVANDNPNLFSISPTVAANGTLSYASGPNANGTATITVSIHDTGGTANGGVDTSLSQTAVITVIPVNDPPVAGPDTFTGAQANTLALAGAAGSGPSTALVGSNILANDTDVDLNEPPGENLTVTAGVFPTSHGGTVTMTTSGAFAYLPPPGFVGSDGLTYTVHDNGNPDATGVGTITITVSGPVVWYVNASQPGVGDGRSTNPFKTLAAFGGAGGVDNSGDLIFLYQGTYAAGLALESSEQLIGQPAGLTVNAHLLVPAGGINPVISGSGPLTATTGASVSRVDLNATGSSTALFGSSVDSFTFGPNTAITASASGSGVVLTGGSAGTISLGARITGGQPVTVSSRASGTVNFTGLISSSAKGIALSGNGTATVNFSGGVELTTTTNGAFSASAGGTVNVTGAGNSLETTTGVALNVNGTTIGASGLRFYEISSSGAPDGIVLNNTGSGTLTVTGGIVAFDGGQILNSTGAGVSLTNAGPVSLNAMRIDGSGADGISAVNVGGLALNTVTITNNGNSTGEDGVDAVNLTGVATLTGGSLVTANFDNDYSVVNGGGSLALTVSGATIGSTSASGNDGLFLDAQTHANISATVTGSNFSNDTGDHFQFTTDIGADGTSTVNFVNNTLTGGAADLGDGITINPAGAASVTAYIASNNIQGAVDSAIKLNLGTPSAVGALLSATIIGNTIGTAGSLNSGSSQGDGITLWGTGNGTLNGIVTGNTIRQYSNLAGVDVFAGSGDGNPSAGKVNVTIRGNIIGNPGTNGAYGVLATAGGAAVSGETNTLCADIGGANPNSLAGSGQSPATDILVDQELATTFQLGGWDGVANIDTFLAGRNSGNGAPTVAHTNNFQSHGACN